jgi:hypothetical protein
MAPIASSARVSSGSGLLRSLDGFGSWLADTLNHCFGNPMEEAAHQPPLVGVQPYSDRPRRRHLLG